MEKKIEGDEKENTPGKYWMLLYYLVTMAENAIGRTHLLLNSAFLYYENNISLLWDSFQHCVA